MRSLLDLLSAGASLASIAGVVIQFYLLRQDRRLDRQPVATTADTAGGALRAPSELPDRIGLPPQEPPKRYASAAPLWAARVSGLGAFLMGLWQLFWIIGGIGWIVAFEQTRRWYGGSADEVSSGLRFAVVVLLVNAVWAALLARRHWPVTGQPLTSAKNRLWFYLSYAAVSAATGIALLITHGGLVF